MNIDVSKVDFLCSALTRECDWKSTDKVLSWLSACKELHEFHVERIPFAELNGWGFDASTGNIVQARGKFFSIEGVTVETNFGPVEKWSQPIIVQQEIGILGVLTRKINGILHFLMQAKIEPGNINGVQLAPTVQATMSNYTRVHGGAATPYLNYFIDRSNSKTLIDTLQLEQGGRFLRKRNRNIIIEVNEEIPVFDDYCWLTLRQIHELTRFDSVVNMDTRSVLSCVSFFFGREYSRETAQELEVLLQEYGNSFAIDSLKDFSIDVLWSSFSQASSLYTMDEVIAWFTEHNCSYILNVECVPLKSINDWVVTDNEIAHRDQKYFSVIAVSVYADCREVKEWSQPMVEPKQQGVVAFVIKRINGIFHFLVQAKVEAGNFDIVEMAPTVQCVTGSYEDVAPQHRPPFLDLVLEAPADAIRVSSLQSEEGGRFFREENRNLIIEVDSSFVLDVPQNYIWMTLNQLNLFIKQSNFVNVEARSILSCLEFFGEKAR